MAANNLFARAKAHSKRTGCSYQDAIQILSGKKKAAPKKKRAAPKKRAAVSGHKKKRAATKKAAPAKKAPRKVKAKIKTGKKGGALTISLSGIHLTKTREELAHQHALERDLQ